MAILSRILKFLRHPVVREIALAVAAVLVKEVRKASRAPLTRAARPRALAQQGRARKPTDERGTSASSRPP